MSDPRFATESSNSAFANYEGTIFDAYFVEGEYGTTLDMKIQLTHPELHPLIEGGLQTMKFNTGKGWTPKDSGAVVVHRDGPDKKFFRNSQMGIFAKRLEDGKLGNFDQFMADIPDDFSLYRAASWKGLTFRFDNAEFVAPSPQWQDDAKTIPLNDAKGKQVYKDEAKERVFPVEYLGKAGTGAASNGSASTSIDLASLSLPEDLVKAATAAVVKGEDLSAAVIKAGGMSIPAVVEILSDAGKTEAFRKALVAS